MNLKYRSYRPELLDGENIPLEELRKNLAELNFINKWLGGHQISICGLRKLIHSGSKFSICEIGCGGGDNLAALYRWLKKKKIQAHFTGIDLKTECIEYAKEKNAIPGATWIVSDYENVLFEVKPDIIYSSLFCHHFNEEQLLFQLDWMKQNSRKGFFINDLHRHWLAYFLIKWITGLFSKSPLVKHDAPLSVARGFKKEEWKMILNEGNITGFYIKWKWAFRHLLVCKHE